VRKYGKVTEIYVAAPDLFMTVKPLKNISRLHSGKIVVSGRNAGKTICIHMSSLVNLIYLAKNHDNTYPKRAKQVLMVAKASDLRHLILTPSADGRYK
jgi:hypothetical protein